MIAARSGCCRSTGTVLSAIGIVMRTESPERHSRSIDAQPLGFAWMSSDDPFTAKAMPLYQPGTRKRITKRVGFWSFSVIVLVSASGYAVSCRSVTLCPFLADLSPGPRLLSKLKRFRLSPKAAHYQF
jgi:hypothetical protein